MYLYLHLYLHMNRRRRIEVGVGVTLLAGVAALNAHHSVWNLTPVPESLGSLIYQAEAAREHAVFTAELLASPAAAELPVPVIGVRARDVADSFGSPRGNDRSHEGVDIFAPRGTAILSVTPGIVARIGMSPLGGNIVFVIGPGGERYYYAHLDEIDQNLATGQRVGTTTILGRVGTTGNASGTPPHLHFGIYGRGGAQDPFGRLR